MNDLLSAVKRDIGNVKCPEHGKTLNISVSGKELKYTACCDTFGASMQGRMNKAVENFTKKSMGNIFKKMGGKR